MSVSIGRREEIELHTWFGLHCQQRTLVVSLDVIICSFDLVMQTGDTSDMLVGQNRQREINQEN